MFTLQAKIWTIWKTQWKHSYLTFWIAVNGLALTTANKYCDFNASLTCSVMDKNATCYSSKWDKYDKIYWSVHFLILHIKFPQFPVDPPLHCVSMNIFVYSKVCYWHHANFAIDRRITIRALKQNGSRCDSRCSILSFGIITKICFLCINNVYLKFRTRSIVFSDMMFMVTPGLCLIINILLPENTTKYDSPKFVVCNLSNISAHSSI